jgi:hypothetical protein
MEKDNQNYKDGSGGISQEKKISIFEGDDYFLYIYKKAEKIATAVYMISDFFSDVEPLKTNIRSGALSLIDMSLSLNTVQNHDRKDLLSNLIRDSLSIISYSEIASRSGIESLMNHKILKSELELFIKTIEDREAPQNLGRQFIIDESVVRTDLPPPPAKPQVASNTIYKTQAYSSPFHQVIKPKTPSQPVSSRPIIGKAELSNRKSDRQEAIIAVIKAKGELSIKDLTGVIKGCSEKTIQRELLVLVDQGILNKVGERRWSRYSLTA